MSDRGFFAIGIEHTKTEHNVGTLWRTASIFGAAFCFTVGRRYQRQNSDTLKSWKHCPLFHFATIDDLKAHLPFSSLLVGVELDERAQPLDAFAHQERSVYLLGAEDHGLTKEAVTKCHRLVKLPGSTSLNVSVAGSIVLYDRITRGAGPMRGRARCNGRPNTSA